MGAVNTSLPLIGNGRFIKPTNRSSYPAEYRSSNPAITIRCIVYTLWNKTILL